MLRDMVDWELHYDRRVTDEFLANFLPGGVADSLVEYAKFAPYPVDLQMRRNAKTGAEHASLYVGLSTVLDVHRKQDRLTLEANVAYTGGDFGFDATWSTPMTPAELRQRWRAVEDYVEAVLPYAVQKYAGDEGPVQVAASVYSSPRRTMVDREVVLNFKDTPTRTQILGQVTTPFVQAVQHVAGVTGSPPAKFGGKCDLLALDHRGRLLAVEIKPRNVGTIVWSPAQATVYARLLERWVRAKPKGTDHPLTVLRGMLDQRARLGLAPLERPGIPERPEVVPVVGIQRGVNPVYLQGLKQVQNQLLAAGCGDPALEVYEVSLAGRMDQIL